MVDAKNIKRGDIIGNDNSSILKKAENSAIEVAKYLLSFDPKNSQGQRQYFTLKIISLGEEGDSLPTEGNFRLNKILHMCQIFHCVEYGKPLFKERMEAFEHGAIVYDIYMSFRDKLYHLSNSTTNLNKKVKDFVRLVFNYFYNFKDNNAALSNFSHDDPAWKIGREQETGLMPLNEKLITYYTRFFDDA